MMPRARMKDLLRLTVAALSMTSFLSGCGAGATDPADPAAIASACHGLPEATMDRGVADLRANVDGARAVYEAQGEKAIPRLVGAAVQVRAAPGMTAQWLGRLLTCDTARHGAAALAPIGAKRDVTPTPVGFTVVVRSQDPELAHEIERRVGVFARPAQAACNTREYLWNEAWNAGGPGRCASDCECDGLRTCLAGMCQGAAR
jgi:hypothetical protein